MATGRDGQVYATLLLSDTYLPGALVLAHSLLDNGTTRKLAVLVTEDTVSREAIAQLETVYHYVIPVPRIQNGRPQNLELMNRLDLHSAFTKIALWKQTQFSKIVYVDADIVAYRAPDELFDIDAPFSAAPDIGWPDIFNTGVMVLTPDLAEYDRLRAMADAGESFDGADQGLLNMHFGSGYNRISFTYNVTPSAHYQYIPAYKHFQSSINMVHFIGAQKPWFQGRPAGAPGPTSDTNDGPEVSPHDRMTGAWWDVYDRHYKPTVDRSPTPQQDAKLVQYLVKGEFDPYRGATPADGGHYESPQPVVIVESHHGPHVSSGVGGEQHPPSVVVVDHVPPPLHIPQSTLHQGDQPRNDGGQPEYETVGRVHHPPPPPPPMEPVWDASRQAPPAHSKPEAPNFPDRKYEISLDSAPFVPPERYPSPPRGMWYDVPRERPEPQQQPKPIFPWENHRPPPTRVFTPAYVTPPLTKPEVRSDPAHKRPDVRLEPIIKRGNSPSRVDSELEPTSPASSTRSVRFRDEDEEIDIPAAGSPLLETGEEGTTPSELSVSPPPPPELIQKTPVPISEFWNASAATNAWDEDPGIRRYIERVIDQTGLGGRRRSDVLRSRMVLDGDSVHLEEGPPPTRQPKHGFFKATDFPGPDERPSLPVTPALPTTPREGWRHSRQEEGEEEGPSEKSPPLQSGPLVEAEGVPRQSEWVCVHGRRWGPRDCLCVLANVLRYHKNPVERLARLAAEPEVILRRLSEDAEGVPDREVVESSEGLPGKRKGVDDGRSTRGVESVPEGTSAVQTGSGGQGKETPLVAPVPLKRRSADPVGNLEAASSGEGGPAGKKPTYSEIAGTTPGRAEGTAAKGNVAKERPAAREGVDVKGTSAKGIAAEKGIAAKEGGSKAGAAAAKGTTKGTATVKSTAAAGGFAAKESALDIAARGRGTELLDI